VNRPEFDDSTEIVEELLKPAQNKHLQVKTVKYGQETL